MLHKLIAIRTLAEVVDFYSLNTFQTQYVRLNGPRPIWEIMQQVNARSGSIIFRGTELKVAEIAALISNVSYTNIIHLIFAIGSCLVSLEEALIVYERFDRLVSGLRKKIAQAHTIEEKMNKIFAEVYTVKNIAAAEGVDVALIKGLSAESPRVDAENACLLLYALAQEFAVPLRIVQVPERSDTFLRLWYPNGRYHNIDAFGQRSFQDENYLYSNELTRQELKATGYLRSQTDDGVLALAHFTTGANLLDNIPVAPAEEVPVEQQFLDIQAHEKEMHWFRQAERHFLQAIAGNPRIPEYYRLAGDNVLAQRKLQESRQLYSSAARLQENDAFSDHREGYQYFIMGNYQKAKRYFDQAIQKDPRDPDNYFWKGNLMFRLGNYEEAIAYYDHCVRIGGFNTFCSLNRRAARLAMSGGRDRRDSNIVVDIIF